MQCERCGEVVDDSSTACPRCGAKLTPDELDATARLTATTKQIPAKSAASTPNSEPTTASDPARSPFGPRRAVYDFAYAARRALAAGGWFDAASAAAVGFLALSCVGLVFLVAARLQYPDIGVGTNPWSVLTSIVVLALGSLRVPIHVGDITVTALPIGALVVSAAVVSWAVEPAVRRREVSTLRGRVAAGAKIALPFAGICCVAALVFRFREGATPTHAGALGAFLWGAIWGTVFGAVAGIRSLAPLRTVARGAAGIVRARIGRFSAGLEAGGIMLAFSFVAAAGASLLWMIVGLLRGAPTSNFGPGDALAGFVYVLAFLPNVLVAVLTVAMGAPLDVGAQVTIGGRQVGPLKTISVWDWGGGAPWMAYALLLVPLVALVGAGYLCRRRAAGRAPLAVVPGGAALFALCLSLLAWAGQARLGAGIVRDRGFAVIAADPLAVLVFAFAWGVAGGLAGWMLAARNARPTAHPAEPAGVQGENE